MRDRTDDNDEQVDAAKLELDATDRALVDTLRALPPEGEEPDWKKLEAAIRAEVSPLSTPTPWWRNWRWLVPIGALATTAAIVMTLGIRNGGDGENASANRMTMRDASVDHTAEETGTRDESDQVGEASEERAAAMWLDGEPADLDAPEALEALDDLEHELLDDSRAPGDVSASSGEPTSDDDSALGVLPAADYQWIDTLRDDEATRLENFLARKRS
jgi:hypothetical protein